MGYVPEIHLSDGSTVRLRAFKKEEEAMEAARRERLYRGLVKSEMAEIGLDYPLVEDFTIIEI